MHVLSMLEPIMMGIKPHLLASKINSDIFSDAAFKLMTDKVNKSIYLHL